MTITRTEAQRITAKIKEAIAPILEAEGYKLCRSTATYSSIEIRQSVTIMKNITDETGTSLTIEGEDYKANAEFLGLDPEALNKEHENSMGERYILRGFRAKARKNCMLIERNGKMFVAAIEYVKRSKRL